MKKRSALAALVPSAALVALAAACSGDEYAGFETYACPPEDLFERHVSPLLERRCATLDCHGSGYQPMRLYGSLGLRHPDESNVSGGAPTTDLERAANYEAVCSIDPEPMADAADDRGAAADKLLVVAKARGVQAHKGGQVVKENDAADRCIVGWIRRAPVATLEADCAAALAALE